MAKANETYLKDSNETHLANIRNFKKQVMSLEDEIDRLKLERRRTNANGL